MSDWKSYQKDWLLLLEAGFIAIGQMDESSASELFKAVETLRADKPISRIGSGFLYLHKLDVKSACKVFKEILEQDPQNDAAKAMLGVSLSLDPETLELGEHLLREVQQRKSPFAQSLIESATSFVDKFLKPTPSPIEGQGKTTR